MKQLIFVLAIILCFPLSSHAIGPMMVGGGTPAVATTNYCNDANAMGCWYMNGAHGGDGSEAETDRTTNGNDLTVSESDTIPDGATVPSGYSGYSRDFELGDADFLTIADGTELDINGANQSISIVAWIKNESIANAAEQYIVGKFNTGQKQYAMGLVGTNTNTFKVNGFKSSNGSALEVVYSTTTTYASGTWYHIAFVYNDTDLRVYVNGSLDCEPVASTTGIFNGSANFMLGQLGLIYGYFDGLIDEVAVFNRELSATEVADIYNNGIGGNKGGSD